MSHYLTELHVSLERYDSLEKRYINGQNVMSVEKNVTLMKKNYIDGKILSQSGKMSEYKTTYQTGKTLR